MHVIQFRPRFPPCRFAPVFALSAALVAAHAGHAQDVSQPERVSFYFAAHEDDWQLFMNPTAFGDVADPKTKTVFIHVTAGDAGVGIGTRGRKHPYFLARENGAEVAIRFMADAGEQPVEKSVSRVAFNGRSVHRVGYRSTVTYFLRLPDGHPRGIGFAETGFQSLERLAKGAINSIAAVDGSASYRGWADLTATVRAIVDYERGRARSVQLNVPETSESINPGDHSDHLMTARLAIDAARDLACARRVYFVDYASRVMPENLAGVQRDMESSVLAVTAAGILALDHASAWHPYHRSYLGRNYFRIEEGVGACNAPALDARQTVSAEPAYPRKQ